MDDLTILQENYSKLLRSFCSAIGVLKQQSSTGTDESAKDKLIASFVNDISQIAAENKRIITSLPFDAPNSENDQLDFVSEEQLKQIESLNTELLLERQLITDAAQKAEQRKQQTINQLQSITDQLFQQL